MRFIGASGITVKDGVPVDANDQLDVKASGAPVGVGTGVGNVMVTGVPVDAWQSKMSK